MGNPWLYINILLSLYVTKFQGDMIKILLQNVTAFPRSSEGMKWNEVILFQVDNVVLPLILYSTLVLWYGEQSRLDTVN